MPQGREADCRAEGTGEHKRGDNTLHEPALLRAVPAGKAGEQEAQHEGEALEGMNMADIKTMRNAQKLVKDFAQRNGWSDLFFGLCT